MNPKHYLNTQLLRKTSKVRNVVQDPGFPPPCPRHKQRSLWEGQGTDLLWVEPNRGKGSGAMARGCCLESQKDLEVENRLEYSGKWGKRVLLKWTEQEISVER